jgi:hypothetical protein
MILSLVFFFALDVFVFVAPLLSRLSSPPWTHCWCSCFPFLLLLLWVDELLEDAHSEGRNSFEFFAVSRHSNLHVLFSDGHRSRKRSRQLSILSFLELVAVRVARDEGRGGLQFGLLHALECIVKGVL